VRRRALAGLALLPGAALAQPAAVLPPFNLARTGWWDLAVPGAPGRRHRVFVAWPEEPPPPAGYPVLYLLDGNTSFPIAVAAARMQERRTAVTGVSPGLLVGLGHPGDAPFDMPGRTRDYTPPAPGAPAGSGEADAFLDLIRDVLRPEIARRWPVDPARQAIFGHSFGGLLVLHAFLTRPGLFPRSIAASPSIWWQDRAVLAAEPGFASHARPAGLGLLLLVGGDEEPGDAPPSGLSAERLARLRQARMLGNARDLAGRLGDLGVEVGFHVFPDENHGSVVPAAISRALRFGLRQPA